MKNFKLLLFAALILSCSYAMAQGGSGEIDSTFNGTGVVIQDNGSIDVYQDVKIQQDGKIIAVGTTYDLSFASDMQVTRLLSDGTYDPLFGNNGIFRFHLGYETGAYACQLKDNGAILVAGISMDNFGGFEMLLIQLDNNGVLDPLFGENGVARFDYGPGEDMAYAVEIQEDGKILLAGNISNENFQKEPSVVRFNENGTLDVTFGANGLAKIAVTEIDNEFVGIQIQSDGKIVAAGHISNGLSWFSLLLARFDTNGNLDNTYGDQGVINMNLNNIDDEFFDIRLTEKDEILATGFTTTPGDLNFHLLLMKFDQNGALISGFGDEGMVIWGDTPNNVGYALEILPDDKIVVAGSSGEKAPMNGDWGIWKFNADGSLDETFGNGGLVTTDATMEYDEALGIAVQEDGKLVAAGKFRSGTVNFGIARYLNDLTVNVFESTMIPELSVMPNPALKNSIIRIAFELTESQTISIQVINLTGTVVMETPLSTYSEGRHVETVALPTGFTAGLYTIRVKSPREVISASKIIVR